MKIKTDFVTNSSSTCYIFESDKKIDYNDISNYYFRDQFDRFVSCEKKSELIEYFQECPCDWIDEIRCEPRYYKNFGEMTFQNALKIILRGKSATIFYLDRGRSYSFEKQLILDMEFLGANLVEREAH